MFTWIKYLPLEWRKRENFCVPSGPVSKVQSISMKIGGSRLRIEVPRHSPINSNFGQMRVSSTDALSQSISVNYGRGYMANEHWGLKTLLERSWAFWGPWMTGAKAQLTLRVSLVGRNDEFDYGKDVSFFHPKAFESALVDYLNDRYGHQGWKSGRPRYLGPVNWKRYDNFAVFSAGFDVLRRDVDSRNPDSLHERFLVFPITHNRFVEVMFFRGIYQLKNWNEPNFDISPVDRLEKSILDSLHLELGADTQAEWDKAKAQFGDLSLSGDFPPLRWPTDAYVPTPMHPDDQAVLDRPGHEQQAAQQLERKAGRQSIALPSLSLKAGA